MNARLSINLSEGTVEAEGSEEFVRFIYQDFKESLSRHVVRPLTERPSEHTALPPQPALLSDQSKEPQKRPSRNPAKTAKTKDSKKQRNADYKPTFNKDLDLTGLDTFYDEFKPEKHAEKILLFAIFFRDRLRIEPCSANDIFTCYFALQTRTTAPTAFVQAFYDAQRKTHFIDFASLTEIRVTIAGNNFFNEVLTKRKGGAAK